MIDELQVSNIALIREATLVPSAGLTVLTGETGAGKTALLSALKLILGERADSSTCLLYTSERQLRRRRYHPGKAAGDAGPVVYADLPYL